MCVCVSVCMCVCGVCVTVCARPSIIHVNVYSKVFPRVHIIYIDAACQSNPCLNGGTCTIDGTDFVCSCIDGYTGQTCASKMCKNMFFFIFIVFDMAYQWAN